MRVLLFRRGQFGLRGVEDHRENNRRVRDRRSGDRTAAVPDIDKDQIPSAAVECGLKVLGARDGCGLETGFAQCRVDLDPSERFRERGVRVNQNRRGSRA